MLRGRSKPADGGQPMTRQEIAVWLGRSMSSTELSLRVTLQIMDLIAFQQNLLNEMYEKMKSVSGDGEVSGSLLELEQGGSRKILKQLAEIRDDLNPVLKAVQDSLEQLEKMI